MWGKTVCLVLFAFLCLVKSDPGDVKKPFSKLDCSVYSLTCLKLDMVSWIDQLEDEGSHSVVPGVNIVKLANVSTPTQSEVVKEVSRKFPDDPKSRLDAYLLEKIQSFVSSRSLKVGFDDEDEMVETGRKKGGKGGKKGEGDDKGMKGMMGALVALKGILFALALKKIALIAGKALFTGTLALVIAAGIGLKSLLHKGHTTYEVVAHPVHSYAKTHSVGHDVHHYGGSGGGAAYVADAGHGDYADYGHGGWGRSGIVGLPAGLKPGYTPPQ